jgi:hypothetical protein
MCDKGARSRHDACVEHGNHGVDDDGANARKAARETGDFHQQNQSHHAILNRFTGTDRVRQNQVALQFFELFIGDAGFGE